jgi:hypothetical protein
MTIPTPYEMEWYRRDPVTGNFVRDEPPVQFTVDDLLSALEAKATDKALIQQQLATIERLSAALVELREHCHSETRQGLLSVIDAALKASTQGEE